MTLPVKQKDNRETGAPLNTTATTDREKVNAFSNFSANIMIQVLQRQIVRNQLLAELPFR